MIREAPSSPVNRTELNVRELVCSPKTSAVEKVHCTGQPWTRSYQLVWQFYLLVLWHMLEGLYIPGKFTDLFAAEFLLADVSLELELLGHLRECLEWGAGSLADSWAAFLLVDADARVYADGKYPKGSGFWGLSSKDGIIASTSSRAGFVGLMCTVQGPRSVPYITWYGLDTMNPIGPDPPGR